MSRDGFGTMYVSQAIRVLIADDHQLLRMGLSIFLGNIDDMQVVGEATNGQEAVELCQRLQPDVVLMDLGMPVMDGMTATGIIAHQYPHTRVIILTSTFSDEKEKEALTVGAYNYLKKNISADVLADAIREAAVSP
ncbi:MAG: response regulator transcription factor [Chloroflexota bacterium]